KKDEDYRFWKTQPVARFSEQVESEGPIDSSKTPDDIPAEPYALLKEFEWDTLDLEDKSIIMEVYELLYGNYVEDTDSTLRFSYSPEFLDWALKAPGWRKDWHVGVRVAGTKKLVAFISGIPVTLDVRGKVIDSAEINFLCIHKKLRSKRLAPVMIKEVTRRINKQNIWQALYTAGVVLPKPVSTCRYYHRSINWPKLNDVGFSPLPYGMTRAKMVAKYALPSETSTAGLRRMVAADVPAVHELLTKYLRKFELSQVFSQDEIRHWMIHDEEIADEKRVVYSYVVDSPDNTLTDFVSFYKLPSTVLGNSSHNSINIAYSFYYASTTSLELPRDDKAGVLNLQSRLQVLFNDALILAKQANFDVFNALTLLDNSLFLEDLKFGAGDGFLNYYLFNYKAFPINGGYLENGKLDGINRSGVAVVML
ncbi:acyl-CoA N-acyltransferase, partial [Dipodascopsis tothii]|uniref:acyl-CoA N-acyltransferase n=1 Tax=Dipodascopsis tothii TaxID=44089 RepID=UPI0034CFCD5C